MPRAKNIGRGPSAQFDQRAKQLNDLLDDVHTKVTLYYYSHPPDVLIEGLARLR